MALGCRAGLASTPAVIVRRPPILQFEVHFLLPVGVSLSVRPRNSDGNPDSPQAIVFLTSIVDVTVGY